MTQETHTSPTGATVTDLLDTTRYWAADWDQWDVASGPMFWALTLRHVQPAWLLDRMAPVLLHVARQTDALMRHLTPGQVAGAWAEGSWPDEGDEVLRDALHAMLTQLDDNADIALFRQSAMQERHTFVLLEFLLDGIKEWAVNAGNPDVVTADALWLFQVLKPDGVLDFALDQVTAYLGQRMAAERAVAGQS